MSTRAAEDSPSPIPPLKPIGTIRTRFNSATGTPIQGALAIDEPGEVVVSPRFEEGLADLEGFSHVVLIYFFDRIGKPRLTVKPYLDRHPRGVFATRSPSRPNPIGMTVVRLVRRVGCRLEVSGVDMLDGTPLLDIKPYVPRFDHHEHARCGWLERSLPELEQSQRVPLADGRFHREEDDER
jgi:tRNA-Thr(GGU) m(6)t(6)A37 methyltransferase TsaA